MTNIQASKTFNRKSLSALLSRGLFSLSLVILLTSCAKIDNVSTNLDRENFENYFDPMKVKMYKDEAEFNDLPHEYVGLVEGEDCQLKDWKAAPDPIKARTEARSKAYKLGANAVVFSSCVTIDQSSMPNSSCYSTLICYGSAYKVALDDKE